MSEAHERPQQNRYTVYMDGWLGFRVKRVFYGIDSSLKDGELLIFKERGFYSLNYARVRWVEAEQTENLAGEHKHA